jgi:hypothetical protein
VGGFIGGFEFWGAFWMINRGEFVVVCVADCGVSQPLIWRRKIRHVFELYFGGRQRGIRGSVEADSCAVERQAKGQATTSASATADPFGDDNKKGNGNSTFLRCAAE